VEERQRGFAAVADAALDAEARQAAELYATYQRVLADSGALDFGDLLLKTSSCSSASPSARPLPRRWQYVLVDDTRTPTACKYRLVQQLVAEHRNLCVVGDRISRSTRGAAPTSNILDSSATIRAPWS